MENKLVVREAKVTYKKVGEINGVNGNSPETISHALREFFEAKELDISKEHFFVVHLNRKNKIINIETAFIGGLSSCTVCIKTILRSVLLSRSSSFVIAHNHPSGDNYPSRSDIAITKKIKEAADTVGLELLDHIIFNNENNLYYSFQENGLI